MPNTPLISVLMPAYNAEKYIGEAIQSILSQSYTNWELIIINDASTDKTKEIIFSFTDERIRYIENETNLGVIKTRNKLAEAANGKYCALLDADDIAMPRRLEKQLRFLEKHPDYALCGSWAYLINPKSQTTGKVKFIDSNNLLKISFLFSNALINPSIMMQTDVLKNLKYRPEILIAEDFDFFLRTANTELKIANLPQFLIKYRWHGANISIENEHSQTAKKHELLRPAIEKFLDRKITKEELDAHFFSFRLYHLGKKKPISTSDLQAEQKWLEYLSTKNKEVKKYSQTDFDAFLFSRWIVCCVANKKYFSTFTIHLSWYKPNVIFKTIKLLLYK